MLNTDHLTRQLSIIPLECLGQDITIIGAGAVGSWTALALAKMGFGNLTVWDDDEVSVENMNCQFFPISAIGQPKVQALRQQILDYTGVEINTIEAKYLGKARIPGIVVAAVDSMAVRKTIWDAHKGVSPNTEAIIDPRMGAEEALLYVMSPNSRADQVDYEKTLYSDSEAVQERCTAKATIYTANLLSGLVCKAVKDLAVKRANHLRTAQWSIGNNQCFLFEKRLG